MTVVAWDGHTLAADRQATNAGTAISVTKIFRRGSAIVGTSGNLPRALAMVNWWANGEHPDKFPASIEDDWASILVIGADKTVAHYENSPYPFMVEQEHYALGSGRDFAYMALRLGFTARRAVELTCELSTDCGNGVDTLKLEGDVAAHGNVLNSQSPT